VITLCSWEGNRGYGIALAMLYKLKHLTTYRLKAYRLEAYRLEA